MGFVRAVCCQDHIFSLNSILEGKKNNVGKCTFACFIDLQNMFDSISRTLLWDKMQAWFVCMAPSLLLLKPVTSKFLAACVRVNGELSEWFDITTLG